MSKEHPDNKESYADEDTTFALLQAIDDKVGNLPIKKGKPWNYPGQPFGTFRSTSKEGARLLLEIVRVPLEASRRGEIALVERIVEHGTNTPPIDFFFFNTGNEIELHCYKRDAVAPYVPPSNAENLTFNERVMHQFGVQRAWEEARLENQRVDGTSRADQPTAEDLLDEIRRAALVKTS